MKALDTNVLVFAEIKSLPFHKKAKTLLTAFVQGPERWALPWPCVYEFLRVITHPRVFHPPVPLDVARADLAAILGSPTLFLLAETERHAEILDQLLEVSRATGNLIHDAHIAHLHVPQHSHDDVMRKTGYMRKTALPVPLGNDRSLGGHRHQVRGVISIEIRRVHRCSVTPGEADIHGRGRIEGPVAMTKGYLKVTRVLVGECRVRVLIPH